MDSVMLPDMVRALGDSAERVNVRWRRLSTTTMAMTGESMEDMPSQPMSGRWDSKRTGISVRSTPRVVAIRCMVLEMTLRVLGMIPVSTPTRVWMTRRSTVEATLAMMARVVGTTGVLPDRDADAMA